MKIRIKGNSLRYRLTKSDVECIATAGYIEETTCFGATTLTYAIQQTEAENLSATLNNNCITLFLPKHMARAWVDTDRVSFEGIENGLYLLAEKDFVCLDNTTEDQSDNYPHPAQVC